MSKAKMVAAPTRAPRAVRHRRRLFEGFRRRAELVAAVRAARGDAGMATAEYAVATLAACGFAGLLLVILRSDEVRSLLLGLVQRALQVG